MVQCWEGTRLSPLGDFYPQKPPILGRQEAQSGSGSCFLGIWDGTGFLSSQSLLPTAPLFEATRGGEWCRSLFCWELVWHSVFFSQQEDVRVFGAEEARGRSMLIADSVGVCIWRPDSREWPQYCWKGYWIKIMIQNGCDDHFGQHEPIPNQFSAWARPFWTK